MKNDDLIKKIYVPMPGTSDVQAATDVVELLRDYGEGIYFFHNCTPIWVSRSNTQEEVLEMRDEARLGPSDREVINRAFDLGMVFAKGE